MDEEFLKRSLYHAFEKILDESLGLFKPEDCVLFGDAESIARIEDMQEVRIYRMLENAPRDYIYGFPIRKIQSYECTVPELKKRRINPWQCLFLFAENQKWGLAFSVTIELP